MSQVMMGQRFVLIVAAILSISESTGLNIRFQSLPPHGINVSPKLRSWIIEAIERGQERGLGGQGLCEHVQKWMTDNHGKYWHCFVGQKHGFHVYQNPGIDNSVQFYLNGVVWTVFRSPR